MNGIKAFLIENDVELKEGFWKSLEDKIKESRERTEYLSKDMKERDNISDRKIPRLHTIENMSLEKKIIFKRYQISEIGFYWLMSELDRRKNIAFS